LNASFLHDKINENYQGEKGGAGDNLVYYPKSYILKMVEEKHRIIHFLDGHPLDIQDWIVRSKSFRKKN
jgi:hypothetical protein